MRETYSHKALQSFALWFDHTLLDKGQAYQNISGSLYPSKDDRIDDDFVTVSSPFKQWVYDSGVSGATICNEAQHGVNSYGRASLIKFDYDNGRLLMPAVTPQNGWSAAYAVKDFNVYTVDTEETKMIFEEAFHINSRYGPGMIPQSGVSPYGYAAPACFIMNTLSENKPWAFGGEQNTTNKFRAIVVSDNKFQLDGCISLFRDMSNRIIPLVNVADAPLNEYGDFKVPASGYNYNTLAAARSSRYLFLDKVTTAKITSTQQAKMNPNLKYAIIDFYLSEPRLPEQDI